MFSDVEARRTALLSGGDRQVRAHEARNAILSIEGARWVLRQDGARLPAAERVLLLDALREEVARLRDLLESREHRSSGTNLLDLVSRRVALVRARGCDVTVEGAGEARVTADSSSLTQILDNLLINAERHGSSDGAPVVAVRVAQRPAHARVTVEDDGPGIPASERERIFARGLRLNPQRREGDGIGLYLSRQLARQLGGDLREAGAPGGGARFVLTLPAAGPAAGAADGLSHRFARMVA